MKLKVFLLLFIMNNSASAGTVTGKIGTIRISNSLNTIAFDLTGPIKNTPNCNDLGMFSISMFKESGDIFHSAIMEAKKNNWTVSVTGLNTCVAHPKAEDVKYITIE